MLVKRVFQGTNPDHVSYWREILRSSVEWSRVAMRMEPAMSSLAYPHLPPSHFMNAQGIRFILPILRSAEEGLLRGTRDRRRHLSLERRDRGP